MFHFPKPRRVLEVGFRIIFYPTKQRSVLEKPTLRISAMQSQRKSFSAPNLFSGHCCGNTADGKSSCSRREEFLSIWNVPWHCVAPWHHWRATSCQHPQTHRAVTAEAVGEQLWTPKLRGWVFSCGVRGLPLFQSSLEGAGTSQLSPCPCKVTGQLRSKVVSWRGKGTAQILPVQSR